MNRPCTVAAGTWAMLVWTAALVAQPPPLSPPAQPPRIAPLPESEWAAELRGPAADFGAVGLPNLVATYAHHPELAALLLPHLRYVWSESTLPTRHRALLALRTAWLTRSAYLWAHRAADARGAGFTDTELERIARGPDTQGWDDFEAALLRAADELIVDAFVSDATWAALTSRYDTNQMIDVVDTVGALTMHAGAASSLGVQLEPNVDERLPAGIPYAVAAEPAGVRLVDGEARIPPVAAQDGADSSPNVFRTFTRNPPADRVRGAVNGYLNSNERITLQPRHRELLMIRIGVLCRSEYEYAAHVRVGRRLGMTDADIDRIVAGPGSGGAPLEDALLRATDELHRDAVVSAQTWDRLAAALDTQQLLDALITVGAYRSGSMLISSAGVQLDANMEEFRFPPSLR